MMRPTQSWHGAVLGVGVAAIVATVAAPRPAAAQVPFQIIRPQEGATVRERVNIQIARAGLPADGYLQLVIDDRFKAAYAIPAAGTPGKNEQMEWDNEKITLLWDTKAVDPDPRLKDDQRVVRDGTHTIQVTAMDRGNRKIGEQKVSVAVANALQAPPEGLPLQYQFSVGDTAIYSLQSQVDYMGGQVQQPGAAPLNFGRPQYNPQYGSGSPEGPGSSGYSGSGAPMRRPRPTGPVTLPVQIVEARFARSTEDVIGGGNFFIRDKATGGSIQGAGGQASRLENVYQLKSRYRTVDANGKIVSYGTLSASKPGAYVSLPIIDLGGGRRQVGQQWQTRTPVYLEWATLDQPPMIDAQNTLEALEWQDNYQTARIRQTARGRVTIPLFGGAGKMENAQIEMTRVIWFAFKAGKIVRMETVTNVDGEAPSNIVQSMVGGSGSSGGPEGSGSEGALSGDPESMPGNIPGVMGGGSPFGSSGSFGPVVQAQEAQKVPAKFRSTQTVVLLPDEKE